MKYSIFIMVILVQCLICINDQPLYAKAKAFPKHEVKIRLMVSGDSESAIYNYIASELRSYDDIYIVDEGYSLTMRITSIRLTTTLGNDTGYCLSVVVTDHSCITEEYIRSLVEIPSASEETFDLFCDIIFNPERCIFKANWLQTGSLDDLRMICDEISNDFNFEFIETDRKLWKQMEVSFNKMNDQ